MPERFLGLTLGKFRIDAIVGTGGFAWVYKAYDPELEIPVALKVLKPQYAGDEQFEQRFRREAATAARLRHPNIIKIFAVGKDGDAVYFAMDYLPQGLPDRLEVLTKLPEPVLIRTGIDVASALGFAHREGVVHRDIKVDNILFDEHGNAIVADFGIARAVSNYVQHTGTNMVVGTPQYFSPEQARAQALDGRADIYSLGVTLYRAATGVLPFNGDDWYEIARQHVEDKPVRPRVHNPLLSRDVERVILRCLEKDPAGRFQTGEALCQALAALSFERSETIAMRSTPSAASSETPTAPIALHSAYRPSWRRPAIVLGVSTAALALTLVASRVIDRPPGPDHPNPLQLPISLAVATPDTARGRSPPHIDPPGAATVSPLLGGNPSAGSAADNAASPTHPGARTRGRTPPAGGTARASRGGSTHTAPTGSLPGTVARSHGYGTLRIDAQPVGASYTLEALGDGHVTKGTVPLSGPLALPAGEYSVVISARYCASYRDTLHINPNRPNVPIRVRLVCGI